MDSGAALAWKEGNSLSPPCVLPSCPSLVLALLLIVSSTPVDGSSDVKWRRSANQLRADRLRDSPCQHLRYTSTAFSVLGTRSPYIMPPSRLTETYAITHSSRSANMALHCAHLAQVLVSWDLILRAPLALAPLPCVRHIHFPASSCSCPSYVYSC